MAIEFITHKKLLSPNHNDTFIQLDDVFSSRHSAYQIHAKNFHNTGDTSSFSMLMSLIDANGNLLSDSNYHYGQQYMRSNADGRQTAGGSTGQTNWVMAQGNYYDWNGHTRMIIHTPYESDRVTYHMTQSIGTTSEHYTWMRTGTYNNATRVTGFRVFCSGGASNDALFEAEITVYGLGK